MFVAGLLSRWFGGPSIDELAQKAAQSVHLEVWRRVERRAPLMAANEAAGYIRAHAQGCIGPHVEAALGPRLAGKVALIEGVTAASLDRVVAQISQECQARHAAPLRRAA